MPLCLCSCSAAHWAGKDTPGTTLSLNPVTKSIHFANTQQIAAVVEAQRVQVEYLGQLGTSMARLVERLVESLATRQQGNEATSEADG